MARPLYVLCFSKFEISKHTCIHLCMMAEGGSVQTTENKTPWEDDGIDNDDYDDDDDDDDDDDEEEEEEEEDEEEVNTTQQFQQFKPGASSTTAYHRGEAFEMADRTNVDPEQSGLGDTVPLLPKYDDFVEDKATIVQRVKAFIKKRAPRVDFKRIVVGLGKKQANQGKAVAFGPKGGETVIFKQDGTFTAAFSKQYSGALGPSAEEILAEDQTALSDAQQRVTEAQQLEDRLNAQAEKQQQEVQKRQQLEAQLE